MGDPVVVDPFVEVSKVVECSKGSLIDRHNIDDVGEEEARHFVQVHSTCPPGHWQAQNTNFYSPVLSKMVEVQCKYCGGKSHVMARLIRLSL